MKPKVTVFTPSYDQAKYISQAIQSVLNQTYPNFEYIIAENSTDPITKRVVKGFKDKRIRCFDENFTPEERLKVYVPAFLSNKYYPKVSGEYIIFLAHDDLFFPNCLEVMVNFLDLNPNVDVCFHDQAILYSIGKRRGYEPLVRGCDKVLRWGKKPSPKDILDGGQMMFRKKILAKISKPYLPETWDTANICDKIFMEKLLTKYPFYPVGRILSLKRVVSTSTHRLRNTLTFEAYFWSTQLLPVFIQDLAGRITGKRRRITSKERQELKGYLKILELAKIS